MNQDARLGGAPQMPLRPRHAQVRGLEIQEPGGEPAQVREVGNLVARGDEGEHERDPHGEGHQPLRRDRLREREHVDGLVGPGPGEREHHAVHGGRGADDQLHRPELHQQERQRGAAQPTQEVVREELAPAHPLLHGASEHEQGEQIESQVQRPGVDEHVGDERPGPLEREQRGEPERGFEARADEDRHLEEKDDEIRDDQPSHPGGHPEHPLRAHQMLPPRLLPEFPARRQMRSHSSGNSTPAARAAWGRRLVRVMPGSVFASRQKMSPSGLNRKSTRE